MDSGAYVSDLLRMGKKFWIYLAALKKLIRIEIQGDLITKLKFYIPILKNAFNAKNAFAFMKYSNWKIIYSDFELEELIKDFLQEFDNVTEDGFINNSWKLGKVDSILAVSLKIDDRIIWICMCNGKNEPLPFLSEDELFFKVIVNYLQSGIKTGIKIGFEKEQIENLVKNYYQVKLKGDLEEIGKYSHILYEKRKENDFNNIIEIKKESDQKDRKDPLEVICNKNEDDWLAEYLEAQLSLLFCNKNKMDIKEFCENINDLKIEEGKENLLSNFAKIRCKAALLFFKSNHLYENELKDKKVNELENEIEQGLQSIKNYLKKKEK